jgi:pimeloyl-ACP methyl ester carboxylesterase
VGIARNGEVELYYERLGEGGAGPVLLINGLGGQVGLSGFLDPLCQMAVDAGLEVIRFDNRDAGLSTEFTAAGAVDMAALGEGRQVPIPYTLHDMVDDALAVLDDAGAGTAHILGMSLGGFIARWLAVDHPARVASLTLLVTGSAAPAGAGPQLAPEAAARFIEFAQPRERDDAIARAVELYSWLWGTAGDPASEEALRSLATAAYERAYRPLGIQRQLLASMASPGLYEAQGRIGCPTLVIQGEADPVFPQPHGEAIAASIPGADYWLVERMGHGVPPEHWPELVQRIAAQVAG